MTNDRYAQETKAEPPVKCLLVDDRPENLLSLSALLQSDAVQVLTAASGREALELLLVHDVALALLDVQMPEMDGFELAELLRGSDRTRHVPLIFVTAGAGDQQRVFKGYEAGAVDFLVKPVDPRILQSKAAVFFELYRTKRRLAEQLAERTESLRLNEIFAAVLGHDLRTPLQLIQMSAISIKLTSEDAVIRGKAEKITTHTETMARMISDLLDASRARQGGGVPVARAPVQLRTLVERVAEQHRAMAVGTPIETSFSGNLEAEWDQERIAQALSNLVGNAVKHGERNAPIRIEVDGSDPNDIVIKVASRGSISAEALPELFKPFRSGGGAVAPHGGLGLGLYIVREIMRGHWGSVDVQTGEGSTTFTLRLPRK